MRGLLNVISLVAVIAFCGALMGFWLGFIGGIAVRVARAVM